jgi:hypothetical protein
VQERGAQRVGLPDELDRALCELDRARGSASVTRQFGSPGAQLREIELGELGRVRYCVPQGERPLDVTNRLGEAEHGFCLACRFDRGDERLCRSTGGGPVGRELGWRRSAAGELVGEPGV